MCGTSSEMVLNVVNEVVPNPSFLQKKSRMSAFFVAWIGCGLFLWAYLGDNVKHQERMAEFKEKLIGALMLFGLFSYMGTLLKWWISDMYGIVTKKLCYSNGTKVWL